MINISRLTKIAVLNRLFVEGPTEELERFKNAALSQELLDVAESTDSDPLDVRFSLRLKREFKGCLLFEYEADESMPMGFILALAERWPKLGFALECWTYADGLTCNWVNQVSAPRHQRPTFGLN